MLGICGQSDIIQMEQFVISITKTNVSCNAGSNASILLSVTGGTPGYSYLWNNGATVQNRNNLSAGTYTVTVTDTKGCTTSMSILWLPNQRLY